MNDDDFYDLTRSFLSGQHIDEREVALNESKQSIINDVRKILDLRNQGKLTDADAIEKIDKLIQGLSCGMFQAWPC